MAACGGRATPLTPHENLLSAAAEFELLRSPNPYEKYSSSDPLGESAVRSALARLENHESLYPGEFDNEIAMMRGRAFEYYGDLEAAAESYTAVGEDAPMLHEEAQRRLLFLQPLREISAASAGADANDLSLIATRYYQAARAMEDPFYQALAERAAESAEVREAEWLAAQRIPGIEESSLPAERALEELIRKHRDSRRALEHALRLARFHAALAQEEVRLTPPEYAAFDEARFRNHLEAAADIYHRLSQADGRREKLLAERELSALLALADDVSDRLR